MAETVPLKGTGRVLPLMTVETPSSSEVSFRSTLLNTAAPPFSSTAVSVNTLFWPFLSPSSYCWLGSVTSTVTSTRLAPPTVRIPVDSPTAGRALSGDHLVMGSHFTTAPSGASMASPFWLRNSSSRVMEPRVSSTGGISVLRILTLVRTSSLVGGTSSRSSFSMK